jgi:ankyrin repeat protein
VGSSGGIDDRFPPAPNGPTLLQSALQSSRPVNIDIVNHILQSKGNLRYAIKSAILTGNVTVFDLIFETICVFFKTDDRARALFLSVDDSAEGSPLHHAIKSRSIEMVLRISEIVPCELERLRPRALDAPLRSPIYPALKYPNFEIVRFLFDNSPTALEIDGATGQTPLTTFARYVPIGNFEGKPALEDLIFEQKWASLVNKADKTRSTALHYAVRRSLLQIAVRILQIPEIAVGMRDSVGMSPFHYAVVTGAPFLMESMLDHAYDLANDANELGRNPLHTAAMENWAPGVQFLLRTCPSLATVTDLSGLTPVLYTAIYGAVESFRWFAECKHAAVRATITGSSNLTKWTMLHFCTQAGHHVMLEELLNVTDIVTGERLFDDVNIRAKEPGITPLFSAAHAGFVKCAIILMRYGADPIMPQHAQQRTAIETAKTQEIRDILVASGGELESMWRNIWASPPEGQASIWC